PLVASITDLINHLPGYYMTIINIINNLPEDSFWNQINAQDIIAKIAQIVAPAKNYAVFLLLMR
ncbi:MAG: hypothetical protein IKA35_04150, partial [Bacteroidaceae bacterium]|nr:hypothetical protein [Bacteroidaceae bacterium]